MARTKSKALPLLERHARAAKLTRREERANLKAADATRRLFTRAAVVNELLKDAKVLGESAKIARAGLKPLQRGRKT